MQNLHPTGGTSFNQLYAEFNRSLNSSQSVSQPVYLRILSYIGWRKTQSPGQRVLRPLAMAGEWQSHRSKSDPRQSKPRLRRWIKTCRTIRSPEILRFVSLSVDLQVDTFQRFIGFPLLYRTYRSLIAGQNRLLRPGRVPYFKGVHLGQNREDRCEPVIRVGRRFRWRVGCHWTGAGSIQPSRVRSIHGSRYRSANQRSRRLQHSAGRHPPVSS